VRRQEARLARAGASTSGGAQRRPGGRTMTPWGGPLLVGVMAWTSDRTP
jgi:hypothetical protein